MSENLRITLGQIKIILSLPIELSKQILGLSMDASDCQDEKYDINVLKVDNERFLLTAF